MVRRGNRTPGQLWHRTFGCGKRAAREGRASSSRGGQLLPSDEPTGTSLYRIGGRRLPRGRVESRGRCRCCRRSACLGIVASRARAGTDLFHRRSGAGAGDPTRTWRRPGGCDTGRHARSNRTRVGPPRRSATRCRGRRDFRRVRASTRSYAAEDRPSDRSRRTVVLRTDRPRGRIAPRAEVRQLRNRRLFPQSVRAARMTETEARDEVCRVGRSLFERGYAHATAGNISVRLDDACGGGYLITPTDACLGSLDPARLARLDGDGRQMHGDRASKTVALHLRIYSAARAFDTGTSCVIHTHSTHCVALTLGARREELLPALTPYFVMKVGHVPVVSYTRT